MKKIRVNLWLIIFFTSLISCDKETVYEPSQPLYKSYFPLEVGSTYKYRMDSILFDDFDSSDITDTVSYFFIDEIIDVKTLEKDQAKEYKFQRKLFPNDDLNSPISTDYYFYRIKPLQVIMHEENISTMVLTFPVKNGNTWNGNLYNSMEETVFAYKKVHTPFHSEITGIDYDSTATVIQYDDENFIEKRLEQRMYAAGKGLVFSEEMDLKFNGSEIPDTTLPLHKRFNQGYIKRLHLVSINKK